MRSPGIVNDEEKNELKMETSTCVHAHALWCGRNGGGGMNGYGHVREWWRCFVKFFLSPTLYKHFLADDIRSRLLRRRCCDSHVLWSRTSIRPITPRCVWRQQGVRQRTPRTHVAWSVHRVRCHRCSSRQCVRATRDDDDPHRRRVVDARFGRIPRTIFRRAGTHATRCLPGAGKRRDASRRARQPHRWHDRAHAWRRPTGSRRRESEWS